MVMRESLSDYSDTTSDASDEDQNCVVTSDSDEGHDNELVLSEDATKYAPGLSNVAVTGSSDIHIGNKNYYNGAVTIKQFLCPNPQILNGQSDKPIISKNDFLVLNNIPETLAIGKDNHPSFVSNSVEESNVDVRKGKPTPESSSSEELHPPGKRLMTPCIRYLLYATLFITMVCITIVILGYTVIWPSNRGGKDDQSEIFPNVPDSVNSPLPDHITFTKAQWGGRPSLNFTKPLPHPTDYVLISHTAGRFCNDYEECAPMLQSMQSEHVAKLKSPDIGYNFLIGGDGNVYVGRGWDIRNFHRQNNVGVSFMGNFVYDSLTARMISALKELLESGVKLNKLPPDYKLVCHNQTSSTLSPGENVFKEIKTFPNFIPGRVVIPPWKP